MVRAQFTIAEKIAAIEAVLISGRVSFRRLLSAVRSRVEAETVVELVYSLLLRGVAPEEIGVVVPYRAQSRLVRSLARRIIEDEETLRKLVIDTVERMQGQEREVVLVSLATSSPRFAEQLAEFFFQPERLNVAITRPRTKLILVGSRRVLEAEPDLPEHQAWVHLVRDRVLFRRLRKAPVQILHVLQDLRARLFGHGPAQAEPVVLQQRAVAQRLDGLHRCSPDSLSGMLGACGIILDC